MAWLVISVLTLILVVMFLWDHRDWFDGRRADRKDTHRLLMEEIRRVAKREQDRQE